MKTLVSYDSNYEWLQRQIRRNFHNMQEGIKTLVEEGSITPESTVAELLFYLWKIGEEPKVPAPNDG